MTDATKAKAIKNFLEWMITPAASRWRRSCNTPRSRRGRVAHPRPPGHADDRREAHRVAGPPHRSTGTVTAGRPGSSDPAVRHPPPAVLLTHRPTGPLTHRGLPSPRDPSVTIAVTTPARARRYVPRRMATPDRAERGLEQRHHGDRIFRWALTLAALTIPVLLGFLVARALGRRAAGDPAIRVRASSPTASGTRWPGTSGPFRSSSGPSSRRSSRC